MSSEQGDSERRADSRRWLIMRVQVGERESVQFANTVRVGEGGLRSERAPGLGLGLDQYVHVVVQGLLSDDDKEQESGEGRSMMVVRITDEHVALTFLD